MTWQNTRTLPRGGARKTALKVDNGWIQTANESGKRFDTFTTLLVCFLPSFIRSLACSHKGYTNDSNSISKSGSSDNKTAQKVQSVLTVQVECPSMLARSLGRSVGRSAGWFPFISFPFARIAQHGTARHGTHNLQIQTNRTLDTIEQTGLEQKQPAKLRTAPKLTLFPSSSLSNALLPLQTCQHLGQLCVLCFLCKSTGPLQKQKYSR